MAGRTGYTAVDNSSPMLGPDQITDVYKHYDALVGESRPTAADLPATGNWLGRQIMAEDTGSLYQCTALPGTWRRIWSPGTPFAEAAGTASVAGTGIPTVNFPAGRFTVAPLLEVTIITTTGGLVAVPYVGSAPSTTSFVVRLFTLGGAQVAGTVHWRAVQMLPTAAAG